MITSLSYYPGQCRMINSDEENMPGG